MPKQQISFITDILLKRFDTYITEINNKFGFIIAFNTFILGTLVIKLQDVSALFSHPKILNLLPFIIFTIFFGITCSLFFAFKAIIPSLDSGNKNAEYHSLIFFGSIAQMEQKTFISKIENQSEDTLFEDLIFQSHCLAICAHKKHMLIKYSIYSTFYGVLLPIVFMAFLKIIEYFVAP